MSNSNDAQDSARCSIEESLAASAKVLLKSNDALKIAFASIENEKVTTLQFGNEGISNVEAVINKTKFRLGCLVKNLTATILRDYHLNSKIDLHASIGDVLPEIDSPKNVVLSKITIQQLLTHSSGVDDSLLYSEGISDVENLRDLTRLLNGPQCEQLFRPGEYYSYSNLGYLIAASIVERLARRNWNDVVNEYFHIEATSSSIAEDVQSSSEIHQRINPIFSCVVGEDFRISNGDFIGIARRILGLEVDSATNEYQSPNHLRPRELIPGFPSASAGLGWDSLGNGLIYKMSLQSTNTSCLVIDTHARSSYSFLCNSYFFAPHCLLLQASNKLQQYMSYHEHRNRELIETFTLAREGMAGTYLGNGFSITVTLGDGENLYLTRYAYCKLGRSDKYGEEVKIELINIRGSKLRFFLKTPPANWPKLLHQAMLTFYYAADFNEAYLRLNSFVLKKQ
jgi:hypothetical protein